MRLLVTGGAGFIGAHLTRAARHAGHDVVVLDDLSSGSWASLAGLDVTRIEGSILDDALLERAMDSVDAVAHLAAQASVPASVADPVGAHAVNVTGTVAVLRRAAEQGAHVSGASSSAVYGRNQAEVLSERDWVRPMSPSAPPSWPPSSTRWPSKTPTAWPRPHSASSTSTAPASPSTTSTPRWSPPSSTPCWPDGS